MKDTQQNTFFLVVDQLRYHLGLSGSYFKKNVNFSFAQKVFSFLVVSGGLTPLPSWRSDH